MGQVPNPIQNKTRGEIEMRNRHIKKQYWLNEEEDNLLKEKCMKAGLSESDFIRAYIKGYKVKEKPDENFYYVLRNLNGIANNINQIARVANRSLYVEPREYDKHVQKVVDFITDIEEMYLTPINKE